MTGGLSRWAKDTSMAASMINARSESLSEKPAFRQAFRKQRCIIPADGFYEWQQLSSQKKQPFYIKPVQEELLALAGLWEMCQLEGQPLLSCTISSPPQPMP
ncbi:MAG: SOS response-associated peptidase [Deinococcales bacterium]